MQLGRYKILKQLANGSIADVLLARATGLEGFARHVVIKRIRPDLATEERLVSAFLDEARIAGSLHHQNIVQVHDVGEQDGAYFFAMEYVHGEDVRRLLHRVNERGEQVPLEHAIAIVTATASGLHYAHEHMSPSGERLGLVHRDVTPANILIGYDGSVKLVDFGLAKAAMRSTTTATGTLRGKASYMSPEQCTGQPIDRRTDIFALGIVLFELVTAQRLFKGANEFMTMAAIVEGQIPRPSTLRGDVPPALDEIILRALQRSPDVRYQTAEALRESLEAFSLARELRTSPKALSDYLIKLFGHRPEPWEAGASDEPAIDADATHGRGLVLPPSADRQQLVARHAARPSSPIMVAQTAEWTDEDEHAATVGKGEKRRVSQQLATEPTATTQVSSTDAEVTKTGRALRGGYPTTPAAQVRSDAFATLPTANVRADTHGTTQPEGIPSDVGASRSDAYATTPTPHVGPDADVTSQTDRTRTEIPATHAPAASQTDRIAADLAAMSQTGQLHVDDIDGGTILEPPIFDAALDAPGTTDDDDDDDAFEQEAATELAGKLPGSPRQRGGVSRPPPRPRPGAPSTGAPPLPGVAQVTRGAPPPPPPAPPRPATYPAAPAAPHASLYPAATPAAPSPLPPIAPAAYPVYPPAAPAPAYPPSPAGAYPSPAPVGDARASTGASEPSTIQPTLYGPTRVFLAKHGTAVAVVTGLTIVGLFGLALRGCTASAARSAAPDAASPIDAEVRVIDAASEEHATAPDPPRKQPAPKPAASAAR